MLARNSLPPSRDHWARRVKAAENRGEFLIAYDLAMQGLAHQPQDRELAYLATRALARSGATASAIACYRRFRLAAGGADAAALGARLAKDAALAAPAPRRRPLLAVAARAYARLFARTRESYPAVNAATLYLLAGNRRRALAFARQAVAASKAASATGLDRYWQAATLAEAALIRGDAAAARMQLRKAAAYLGRNYAAAASTRQQLRLVCSAQKIAPDIVDVLRPPMVLHYGGRVATAPSAAPLIADYLARRGAGFAYGSLAGSGDILFAEACLAQGIELNVILPFRDQELVDGFVRHEGRDWVRRFDACRRAAHSLTFATTDAYQGDDALFDYADRLAMGMACLRAQQLDTICRHVSVVAQRQSAAGTAVSAWRQRGWSVDTIGGEPMPRRAARGCGARGKIPPRYARAILFGDVKGYSRLTDHLIPLFQRHVMGTIAAALRRYRVHVLYRNSWGDAIYVVIDEAGAAAQCALAIQAALARCDFRRLGFAQPPELRLAVHYGPLYDGFDAVCNEPTFFGVHATMAARLEPVTPPGHVYVTEAMAAALAISPHRSFRCNYVGVLPAAKDFGLMRMYALDRIAIRPPLRLRAPHA